MTSQTAVGAVLGALLLVAAVLAFRSCQSGPPAGPAPSAPTERESRSLVAAERGEEAAHALLGESTESSRRADSLLAELHDRDVQAEALAGDLDRARAALDRALAAAPDTVRLPADTVRVYLRAERAASDAALAACEGRTALAETAATEGRRAALSAYAAADSALAALGHTRLAYREADARATALALRTAALRRQRDVAIGVAAVGVGCAAVLLAR